MPGPAEITEDEKTFACLAHALMIPTSWVGPLAILLIQKKSQFVSFHALQALLWQIFLTVLYVASMAAFFAVMIGTVVSMPQGKTTQPPQFPIAIFVLFPIFWLIMMGSFAVSLTLGIIYAIKAVRGEWADYPLIGRWARRIVGIEH